MSPRRRVAPPLAAEGAETGIQRDTEYYYADQEAHGNDVVPETEVAKALRVRGKGWVSGWGVDVRV
jgi:hypothetical protein